MRAPRRSARAARSAVTAIAAVVTFGAAAAHAAPGYRMEFPADAAYTAGTDLVFGDTQPQGGRGTSAPFDLQLYDARQKGVFVSTRGFVQLGATFGAGGHSCLPAVA